MAGKIAFQGEPGAYSHEACAKARPDHEVLPCHTFEDVIEAVRTGEAELACRNRGCTFSRRRSFGCGSA